MPRISTDNYDTVASWNGSQDLFVVEQPDGTKVATPSMVKQFIEAGDFEATGEVKDGHGNILADMAKSADVDAEIGNLSQTGLIGDSVAEQLKDLSDDLTSVNHAVVSSHANVTASSVFCYSVGNIVVVSGWLKVNTAIPTPASNTALVTFADTMPLIPDNHRAFFAAVNSVDDTVRAMKFYQRSILLDSKNIPAGDYTINGVCIV